MPSGSTFVVRLDTDRNWLAGRPSWEQPYWTEHAEYIDALQRDGILYMAGPLADFTGMYLIVQAQDADSLRTRLQQDPWWIHALARIRSIDEWVVLMDPRVNYKSKLNDLRA